MNYHILIVENEPEIRELIALHLNNSGMDTFEASSGREAVSILKQQTIDLILLDLMMEDMNGWELLRYLKANLLDMPVIVLSARRMESDKIETLDLGADDYVTKPFSFGELVARVQANLRRYKPNAGESKLKCGDLVYDTAAQMVEKPSGFVSLSPIEGDLLELFMRHPGRVFTKVEIYKHVWKLEQFDDKAVIVYINLLRKKIEDDPSHPHFIQTIRGIGYRFVEGD